MFVAKWVIKILLPFGPKIMIHWFIWTTGLTMPHCATSLTKWLCFLKKKEYFKLEKVHLKDRVKQKSIKAYQGGFYYITFKCKLTILPRKNSFCFSI